jgi:UDPglucose 6-dehydrogenase
MDMARPMLEGVTFCSDAYDAAKGADAVVLVTEWDVFRALDMRRLAEVANGRVLVDLRNVWDKGAVERAGFTLTTVGR